jgi:carboxymethylenebutenolidase
MKRIIRAAAIVAASCALLGGCAQKKAEDVPRDAAPADTASMAAGTPSSMTGPLSEADFKALHTPPVPGQVELHGTMIDLAGGKAYLSLPSGPPPVPGIVVIQEWWGLNDNIKHWADRLAADGYAALAVDLYEGKVTASPDEAMELMKNLNGPKATSTVLAAHDFLQTDSRVQAPKTGSIGWCMGGHWSLQLAINEPDLDAAVLYYGFPIEDLEQLRKIKAPLLGIFGNKDTSIPPSAVDAFDKALTTAAVTHEFHRYDADHAFANPSNTAAYDETNAGAAWEVARAFLAKNLK